jgi:hypothetical protein
MIVPFYTIYTSRQRGSLKLVDSIASVEVEKQIVHNVLSTIKANQEDIEYEIGIETSLDEKDVFNYVQQVIKETRTK